MTGSDATTADSGRSGIRGSGSGPSRLDEWQQTNLAYALRLSPRRWNDIEADTLFLPVSTVVGAWLLLAWGRFGVQSFASPGPVTRFVLVGVYGWLGLTVVLAVLLRVRRRPDRGDRALAVESPVTWAGFWRLAGKVGQSHQPLAFGGLTILFLDALPTGPVLPVIAALAVTWMGGQLIVAVSANSGRPLHTVAAPTLVAWIPWLATAGRFLWLRLGHVL